MDGNTQSGGRQPVVGRGLIVAVAGVLAVAALLLVASLVAGSSDAEAQVDPGTTMEIVVLAGRADGWVRHGDTRNWVSAECRSQLVNAGADLRQVSWPTVAVLTDAVPFRRCDTLVPDVLGQVQVVTLAGRSDGWLRVGGTRNWVSAACRAELENAGAVTSVTAWATVAGLVDAVPFRRCDTLVPDVLGQVQVVTLAGRSDGWLRVGGTRNWVSAACRAELENAGAVTLVGSWATVAVLTDAVPFQRCDTLVPNLFDAPDDVEIVITADKWPDGNDGWVRMANGSKQWVSGDCRMDLVAAGAVLVELPWPSIDNMPESEPWRGCPDLIPFLFGSGTTPTATATPTPPGQLTPAENLALIAGNGTRNTQFDNNPFRDVPASDIQVSDLTVNSDIYNEALLDTTNSGYFRVKCEVSHFAYDDPIVFPNQPGRAHLHMFFGNTEANAYSTFDSLLNTGTGTCNGEDLNRTAYWVPAMLDSQGNALIPDQIMVYYKNDNYLLDGANELVSPFPDNLRMVTGNAGATSPQTDFTGAWQAQTAISFSCGPAYQSNDVRQALIPDCSGSGNHLEMQIAFPQCVNEAAGTYQSDQSHVSYSENGYYGAACPDSHPTDISSIMYRIFFRPDDYGGSLTDLHLSSDVKMDQVLPGGTTAHADWFGAWHPETMDLWVENCNNTQADCETGLLQRNPPTSLVLRKRNFYPRGYLATGEELVKLCPGRVFDANDPLRSVSMCRMN